MLPDRRSIRKSGHTIKARAVPAQIHPVNSAKAFKWRGFDFLFSPVCTSRCQLYKLLSDYRVGVEIGVFRGVHAELLLSRWPGFLHLVDPWESHWNYQLNDATDDLQATKERLQKYPGRYTLWKERDSYDLAGRIGAVDFAYIDGCHLFEYVWLDLQIWWDRISPGGLLMGHDIMQDACFGVTAAVVSHAKRYNREVFIIPAVDHCPCGDGSCAAPSFYMKK